MQILIHRILSVFLAVCLMCPAQQREGLTFRTSATLVEFPIVVLDGKGNPVTDLKREEVSISDDGQQRNVAVFRFDGATGNSTPKNAGLESLAPGMFSNRPQYSSAGASRNHTVIALDTINTSGNPRSMTE